MLQITEKKKKKKTKTKKTRTCTTPCVLQNIYKIAKVIFCAYHSLTVYPLEYSASALTLIICPFVISSEEGGISALILVDLNE